MFTLFLPPSLPLSLSLSLTLSPPLPLALPHSLSELDSTGDQTHPSDHPASRKPKRGAEIRRRRVSKSQGSPYRTSQGSSGHEEVDGHPTTLTPLAMGGVALSTAMATALTTDGGVIEDKPSTSSPEHCTSNEGRHGENLAEIYNLCTSPTLLNFLGTLVPRPIPMFHTRC